MSVAFGVHGLLPGLVVVTLLRTRLLELVPATARWPGQYLQCICEQLNDLLALMAGLTSPVSLFP